MIKNRRLIYKKENISINTLNLLICLILFLIMFFSLNISAYANNTNNLINTNLNTNDDTSDNETIQQINVDKDSISLTIGDTDYINFSVVPKNITNTTVKFTSSDNSVVTVQQDGTIISKGVGKAHITISTDNSSAEAKILVKVLSPESTKYSFLIIAIEILIILVGSILFFILYKKQLKIIIQNEKI